ncbi:DeoR/GlpR transcriptional regulator [Aureimonas fodinaquatilis]|uniref:DeoR/GlpR transcriptional regulator n=1 Tax=Aureimonas fodinaquatilis TaxID=2565783 RepID=A0A5B0E328_9HYPH|nr:DeoR/GlpR family DNA-binding transcription regulator [Aureimonas fodinaquatilis]KAA0972371.1 DeoR/GlpR transcriptional regulator [Aureimonas fodinaquatilis]
MIPLERQSRIVDILAGRPAVGIAELTRVLKVSHMTVRRDLRQLERAGRVATVAGGARLTDSVLAREAPHIAKAEFCRKEKEAIGAAAASFVEHGAAIYLDAGTTVLALAQMLVGRDDLTVVTNDFAVLEFLSANSKCVLHHTGGMVDRENRSCVGEAAARAIQGFRFDTAFISSSSFGSDGLSVTDPGKTLVKQAANESAVRTVLLADSTKFGQRAPYAALGLDRLSIIVSDEGLSDDAKAALTAAGVEIVIAKGGQGERSKSA